MVLPGKLTPERMARIRFLIFDVDGVLTDGRIIYGNSGEEFKSFDCLDGAGIKYWHRAGHASAIITGRGSLLVERRAKELGIHPVFQHQKDKVVAMRQIMADFGLQPGEAVMIGDDLPDIPAMREAGAGIAVANATAEVREFADAVTTLSGGRGAVREVIESILKAQGRWDGILARYFPDRTPSC